MLNFKWLTFGIVATFLATSTVFANNNSLVTSSTSLIQQPKKESRRWGGFLSTSRSTNLYDFDDGSKGEGMDHSLRFNFQLNKQFAISATGGYSQDLKYPERDDFSNTSISIARSPFALGKRFLLGYRLGTMIPTSKDSRVRQSLQTALSGGLSLTVNPNYLIRGFSAVGLVTAARNFHQYDTGLDGRVNTQYTSAQTISLAYSFSGFANGLYVSADFAHRNTWSYQNVMRDSFELSQEIGYEFNKTFSLSAGHTNSGATLKPNAQDSNVSLVSDTNSIVYASATVIF